MTDLPAPTTKHLSNAVTHFNCPQVLLSLHFQCRDVVSKYKRRFGIEKSYTIHRLLHGVGADSVRDD